LNVAGVSEKQHEEQKENDGREIQDNKIVKGYSVEKEKEVEMEVEW